MSAFITVSSVGSKELSALQIKSPTVAVAAMSVVKPPGFAASMVTYRTIRPPVSVTSMLLTAVTVPASCSPVSVSVSVAPLPAPMEAASPDKNGSLIFMTLSS